MIQLQQGEKGKFVLTKGMNGTLVIFDEEKWEQFSTFLQDNVHATEEIGRLLRRFFIGSAIILEANDDGELCIPDLHWKYLNFGKGRVEVCSAKEYINKKRGEVRGLDETILDYASYIVLAEE